MNPPKLNLRQFLSYLAPGGYYLLQILFLFSFALWLISNTPLSIDLIKKDVLNNTLVITGFIVLIVLSYFMGIILRLYSVDDIDRISADFQLRKEIEQYTLFNKCPLLNWSGKLWYHLTKSFWGSQISVEFVKKRIGQPKPEYKHDSFLEKLNRQYQPPKPVTKSFWASWASQISVEFVKKRIGQPKPDQSTESDQIAKSDQSTESEQKLNKDNFCVWFNQKAASKLIILNGNDKTNLHPHVVQQNLFKYEFFELSDLLWLTDDFPYPLWHTYSACLRSDLTPSDINQHLWPVLKATLHGKIPADAQEKPTKIPFNHCKLFVLENSPTLATEIYEREALVRMMAGFYHGAKIGLNWSIGMFIILAIVWLGKHCISGYMRELELSELKIAYLTLTFSIGFNAFLKHSIIENFRHLRSSETNAVFDSYLIVKNRLSKSNVNRR